MLDPKRVRARSALAIRYALGSPSRCTGIVTSSLLVCSIASLWLSCLPLPLAPMVVVERIVDLPAHPQPMQEHA